MKAAKQALRRNLANSLLGDLVRHFRYRRKFRLNLVHVEAIRHSLQDNQGRLIIVFPVVAWGFRWQRPQQIISHLRDNGYSIFYLATSTTPFQCLFRNSQEAVATLQFENLAPHVYQISLHSKDSFNIYADPLVGDDLSNMFSGLRLLLANLKPKSIHYLIHFHG